MSGISKAAKGQTEAKATIIKHHPNALFPPPCGWCGQQSRFEGPDGTPFCSVDCAGDYLGIYPSRIKITEATDDS